MIYVNGAYRSTETPLGWLIHDLHCKSADGMLYPVFAERMRYFKEERGGDKQMSRIMDNFREEIWEETHI